MLIALAMCITLGNAAVGAYADSDRSKATVQANFDEYKKFAFSSDKLLKWKITVTTPDAADWDDVSYIDLTFDPKTEQHQFLARRVELENKTRLYSDSGFNMSQTSNTGTFTDAGKEYFDTSLAETDKTHYPFDVTNGSLKLRLKKDNLEPAKDYVFVVYTHVTDGFKLNRQSFKTSVNVVTTYSDTTEVELDSGVAYSGIVETIYMCGEETDEFGVAKYTLTFNLGAYARQSHSKGRFLYPNDIIAFHDEERGQCLEYVPDSAALSCDMLSDEGNLTPCPGFTGSLEVSKDESNTYFNYTLTNELMQFYNQPEASFKYGGKKCNPILKLEFLAKLTDQEALELNRSAEKRNKYVSDVRALYNGVLVSQYTTVTELKVKGYTVTYLKGDDEASGTMEPGTAYEDEAFTLPDCGFNPPEGFEFAGWSMVDDDTVREAGSKYTFTGNRNVIALWAPKPPVLPASTSFSGKMNVTITAPENMAVLYSLDGSNPSLTYSEPIEISETTTVRAQVAPIPDRCPRASRIVEATYRLKTGGGNSGKSGGGHSGKSGGDSKGDKAEIQPATPVDTPAKQEGAASRGGTLSEKVEVPASMENGMLKVDVGVESVKFPENFLLEKDALKKELELRVLGTDEADSIETHISSKLTDAMSKADAIMYLKTQLGAVNVPPATMYSIKEQSGDSGLKFSMEKKDLKQAAELTGGMENLIKRAEMSGETLHFADIRDIKLGAEDKGNITSFGGNKLEIFIPLSGDQKANHFYDALAISDDGSVEKNTAECVIKDGEKFGKVETSHLTTFIITNQEVKNPFTDVKEGDYFFQPVLWAVDKEVTGGVSADKFAPATGCSRAQMVTFLWRAAGKPWASANKHFSDVAEGSYYKEAVEWAVAAGITRGISEDKFNPKGQVTREQLASFIYRYAQSKGQGFTGAWAFPLDYGDAGKVSSWADEAVHWCVMKEILGGTGSAMLSPQGTATRGQIVTMLYRYFNL